MKWLFSDLEQKRRKEISCKRAELTGNTEMHKTAKIFRKKSRNLKFQMAWN